MKPNSTNNHELIPIPCPLYRDRFHIVFRNRGVRTSLLYEGSDVRKKLQAWKSPEVQIEKLPTALHNQMVINGHTLTAAIESKDYHPLERSNLRRLLRSIYAEFEKAQSVLLP